MFKAVAALTLSTELPAAHGVACGHEERVGTQAEGAPTDVRATVHREPSQSVGSQPDATRWPKIPGS